MSSTIFISNFVLQAHFHNITINVFPTKKSESKFLLVLEIFVWFCLFVCLFCRGKMPFQISQWKLRKGKGFSSNRSQIELFDILDTQTHLPRAN